MTQPLGEAHIQSKEPVPPSVLSGKTLVFPQGVVGFPDLKTFFLRPLSGGLEGLLRIDSQDQAGIGFYLLPVTDPAAFYTEQDINQALSSFCMQSEEALFFLIVSSQQQERELILTINVRAPLVVNVSQRQVWQYVFVNQHYEITKELVRLKQRQ